MKRALLIAAVIITTGAGAAHAGEVYAGAGLPGLMLGYAQPIDERFTVRGDWATLGSRQKQTTQEGVNYDAKVGFNRLGLFADWFVSGGFRFTGGVTFNNLKADLVARGDGVTQFTIGGQTFTSDPADRLNVKVSYPKVTPYLGRTLQGRVTATWLRGQLVQREGKFEESALGQPLLDAVGVAGAKEF